MATNLIKLFLMVFFVRLLSFLAISSHQLVLSNLMVLYADDDDDDDDDNDEEMNMMMVMTRCLLCTAHTRTQYSINKIFFKSILICFHRFIIIINKYFYCASLMEQFIQIVDMNWLVVYK